MALVLRNQPQFRLGVAKLYWKEALLETGRLWDGYDFDRKGEGKQPLHDERFSCGWFLMDTEHTSGSIGWEASG